MYLLYNFNAEPLSSYISIYGWNLYLKVKINNLKVSRSVDKTQSKAIAQICFGWEGHGYIHLKL